MIISPCCHSTLTLDAAHRTGFSGLGNNTIFELKKQEERINQRRN